MSVIEKRIKLEGSKGEKELVALFDSGATYSCISTELADKLEILVPLRTPREFATANQGMALKASHAVRLDF